MLEGTRAQAERETGVRAPWRPGPRLRRLLDVAPVGVLALVVVLVGVQSGDRWWLLLGLAQTVPLIWRRSHAGMVYAVVAGASAVQALVVDIPIVSQLAYPVALYNLARHRGPLAGAIGLGVGLAGAVVASVVWVEGYRPPYVERVWADYVPYAFTVGAIVVVAWALGTLSRVRESYVAAILEQGERRVVEAEQRVLLAAGDERARIAREMHDVVAHGLSVIVVQADGARYAAAQDPDVAVRTLETVAATGRASLADMRRLLGLLRTGEQAERAPQPGLPQLDDLIDLARGSGTRVTARLPAEHLELSEGDGLTVYRIVQESLTNVRKHAGPDASVAISVHVGHEVDVTVSDTGSGGRPLAPGGDERGLGLLGMGERVAVHGGELTAGPGVDGGWVVRARWTR
ncbi:sensor histidine kinase [Aeromicrobium sp. Sec7.5]|uniref:sensor histidine kinase n=1 Tax=Aeromicrobium sp. Sec7.5 TaxID=3121276 RepID=UPI002FE4A09C